MSVFCECDRCGKEIHEGDNCYSLTLSKDFVESIEIIQPLEATNIVNWCLECGPRAVREIRIEPE